MTVCHGKSETVSLVSWRPWADNPDMSLVAPHLHVPVETDVSTRPVGRRRWFRTRRPRLERLERRDALASPSELALTSAPGVARMHR
jgi:hypothetical protein